MNKKWWILLFYIFIVAAGLYYKNFILDWVHKSDSSDLPVMFVLSFLLAAIPFIPFTIFAGLMGAKYGVVIGTLINWTGGVTAAVLYFFLSRIFFRNFFMGYVERVRGIQRLHTMLERNAFIAILLMRLIAIFPPPIVNTYTGISTIPFRTFLLATAFGLIPPMFMIAFSGEQIFTSIFHLFIGVLLYLLFLIFIVLIYRQWFAQSSKQN
ncbi:TVP38/TMEM64 family protein [Bacillus sp. S/N-304-OC-R1]|uniref:TVP38/TMEM64 family protein n=1 Tax=Bacillus sp. S/N-304-OC-R1 TaxID=2758034 RepID=UPI001C8D2621|nr:VTT domain-containing protein [Bacillus sp. S/N-304-OC-R1]MBY0123709.1 TVP38/TMEM64 family protein [Bacillus sp. S/N-304-OC-R1]